MDAEQIYDGIWACASLLHISRAGMPQTLDILRRALCENGILYTSFKYGEEELMVKGRFFSNYNEESMRKLIFTEDVRENRRG